MLNEDDNNFSKQRRNLVLISALILAKDYLDITYDKFTILNSGITVGNPDGLHVVLWMLWLYFLIRYFNLFFEVENKFKVPISKKYYEHQQEFAKKEYLKNYKTEYTENIQVFHSRKSKFFKPILQINNREFSYSEDIPDQTISAKLLILFLFKSTVFYIFKTHCFFEYYFPIFFALLPLWTLKDYIS